MTGLRVGMKSHTYWSEVLEITKDCKACDADLIIILRAGSLTDAAKIVSLVSTPLLFLVLRFIDSHVQALANDATTPNDLMRLQSGTGWLSSHPEIKQSVVPVVCIPTTLSGGTNDETHAKHGFAHGTLPPTFVALDAALTTTTPDKF